MTKRRNISTRERVKIFVREGGVCHICHGAITIGQLWDVSHDIPLELGGDDHGDNLKVAHRNPCHREHTRLVDVPNIAKAKRREAKHLGAAKPKSRLQGAGFQKAAGQNRATRPISKLAGLPRASLFKEEP